MRVWSVENGNVERELRGHSDSVEVVAWWLTERTFVVVGAQSTCWKPGGGAPSLPGMYKAPDREFTDEQPAPVTGGWAPPYTSLRCHQPPTHAKWGRRHVDGRAAG